MLVFALGQQLALNPILSMGIVGEVQERRGKGGWVEKKGHAARLRGPGHEPGTYRNRKLGESPQLHRVNVG